MPTGYTADIAKGISFPEYVWSCARAFGALVTMRDDPTGAPIPQRFEPSNYNATKLTILQAERYNITRMTNAEADNAATTVYDLACRSHEERLTEKRELRARYLAMRAQAEAWNPPSNDHAGLKDFMVKQIDDSIEWDCTESYMTAPTLQTGSAWRAAKLAEIEHSIQYHHDENAKEIARTETRNVWLLALRASVPQPGIPSEERKHG